MISVSNKFFTVTTDPFNTSLLNKLISLKKKTDPKPLARF